MKMGVIRPSSACIVFTLVCGAAFAQQALDIKWVSQRLSVHVSNAPLAAVMSEVARVADIEIDGADKLTGVISADFDDLEPRQALATLLSNVNHLVQERRPGSGDVSPKLFVSVHSMAGYALPAAVFSGPLEVPALNAWLAAEILEIEEERDTELADDPDAYYDELRENRLAAARLATEGAFGPTADAKSLMTLLSNYNDEIRIEALKALVTRPTQVGLPALIESLGDELWEIRTIAIEALGRANDPQSLEAVGRVLLGAADDRDTRIDALRVLALRGDSRSQDYLRAALEDTDEFIRRVAEHMLTELDRREANARTLQTVP